MANTMNICLARGTVAAQAIEAFLKGKRVLYSGSREQVAIFWLEVTEALAEPLAAGVYDVFEGEHVIRLRGTRPEIRATSHPETFHDETTDLFITGTVQ